MINVSNEYKQVIRNSGKKLYSYAEIRLSDNKILNLNNSDIMVGGMRIDDSTSNNNKFDIGAAIINQLTLIISNFDCAYDTYDFTDTIVYPSVGLQLSESIETISKGVFTVDEANAIGGTIVITAYDNMSKFDKPFKDVPIVFPTTAQLLLTAVCTHCGVSLATTTFLNNSYVIQTRPLDDAINCREVVSWIAGISGNFARCNASGQLELKWYDTSVFEQTKLDGGTFSTTTTPYSDSDSADGGNFMDYSSGDNYDGGNFTDADRYHHIYALNQFQCATDDVVITGISVNDSAEIPNTVLFGLTGYVISITENKLIQSLEDATLIANSVGAKIVGMRFRPCSLTAISDPSREAGDVAYVTDRKQNTYQILLSSVSFGIGSADKISCDAESPARNSSVRYSADTKAIIEARKNTETQLTAYDLLVQQMSDVITHGYGMFQTKVIDESGATIFYLHDKPVMSESSIRWFTTSEGTIEQTNSNGTWVTVSGTDKQGNALYNVLTARKISADIIRTGKIYSNDGATLIDMAFGVANSDNISFVDNIQNNYPLTMPFNIDDNVSKMTRVLMKYTQQKFRTYSDASTQSNTFAIVSDTVTAPIGSAQGMSLSIGSASVDASINYDGAYSGSTGQSNATSPHVHSVSINSHTHGITVLGHTHSISGGEHTHIVNGHSHTVEVPAHYHSLLFGIMETAITDYSFDIYVDGEKQVSITNDSANAQGIIDLTAWVTTTGWHTIEVRSTTLKRISAQVNIKSYIRM